MNTPETSKYEEKPALAAINDDILIHIFSFMGIEDILSMRQVSSRMRTVSRLRIVWQRALRTHVLDRGFPFPAPSQNLSPDVDESTLEALTRRAYALGQFWQRPQEQEQERTGVKRACTFVAGSSATGVAQVRFLPARPGCVVALSKGIWSVLTCWDVGIGIKSGKDAGGARGRAVRVAEWAPRQTLITSLAVNEDSSAEACLAVSVTYSGSNAQTVQIMTIDGEAGTFVTLCTLDIPFRAMTLRGDILAASDDVNETHIINWRTQEYAVLWGSDEPSEHNFQHNHCLQVMFAPQCIFVVRARSLEVFPRPILHQDKSASSAGYIRPMGCHRFGWIDGISMSVQKLVPADYYGANPCADENVRGREGIPPMSILLRAESDDPWASDVHTLDLYVLHPNPDWHPKTESNASASSGPDAFEIRDLGPEANYKSPASSPRGSTEVDTDTLCTPLPSPYLFPPVRTASWASTRGHLRCRDILVGSCGTALWIQPKPARNVGLTAFDVRGSLTQGSHEGETALEMGKDEDKDRVVAVVLPGMLKDSCTGETVRTLYAYEGAYGMWRCVDYDEARGWLALGDSQGRVDILELGRTDAEAYRGIN